MIDCRMPRWALMHNSTAEIADPGDDPARDPGHENASQVQRSSICVSEFSACSAPYIALSLSLFPSHPHTGAADVAKRVTVVFTTSPVQSNPDTSLVEMTFESMLVSHCCVARLFPPPLLNEILGDVQHPFDRSYPDWRRAARSSCATESTSRMTRSRCGARGR
jgi:hypothetical protein